MPEESAPVVRIFPTLVTATVLAVSTLPPEPPMLRLRLLLPALQTDFAPGEAGAHAPRKRVATREEPPLPPPPPMLCASMPLELLPSVVMSPVWRTITAPLVSPEPPEPPTPMDRALLAASGVELLKAMSKVKAEPPLPPPPPMLWARTPLASSPKVVMAPVEPTVTEPAVAFVAVEPPAPPRLKPILAPAPSTLFPDWARLTVMARPPLPPPPPMLWASMPLELAPVEVTTPSLEVIVPVWISPKLVTWTLPPVSPVPPLPPRLTPTLVAPPAVATPSETARPPLPPPPPRLWASMPFELSP